MLLEPYHVIKRRVILAVLTMTILGATVATVVHRLEAVTHPVNLIAPPLLAITSLGLFLRLYTSPKSLHQVIHWGLIEAVLFVVLPSWIFTLEAFLGWSTSLVDKLPPLTSALFLLTLVMLIALRPHALLQASFTAWMAIALPILIYLILHPGELMTARGLDLFISLGPAMAVQLILIVFYHRLQKMVECLYAERFQYYDRIIERQTIRQQAMEQVFTQIHNGPLQTLALLLRDVQRTAIPSGEVLQRLDELNGEIRAIGISLRENAELDLKTMTEQTSVAIATDEQRLRIGEGSYLDLDRPLHSLLHEVYALTLKRQLPYFKTIRVKVRNFAALEQPSLTLETKRDICLWLEEALCNVGKHALGVTQILVTGEHHQGQYFLKVQDNGPGMTAGQGYQGTKQSKLLAKRLKGNFRRVALPQAGLLCELCWPVD